jgi:hypothetical protein
MKNDDGRCTAVHRIGVLAGEIRVSGGNCGKARVARRASNQRAITSQSLRAEQYIVYILNPSWVQKGEFYSILKFEIQISKLIHG